MNVPMSLEFFFFLFLSQYLHHVIKKGTNRWARHTPARSEEQILSRIAHYNLWDYAVLHKWEQIRDRTPSDAPPDEQILRENMALGFVISSQITTT